MEDEQRKIYDAYRNDYRDKIMEPLKPGIQKSQLTILQASWNCGRSAIRLHTEWNWKISQPFH